MKLGIASLAKFVIVLALVNEIKFTVLGQKPQAAVGSKRATRTEVNRFTALLSRMGFRSYVLHLLPWTADHHASAFIKPGTKKPE